MGGMSGLSLWSITPTWRGISSRSVQARPLPFAIAVRSLQRELIRCDPKWQDGEYDMADQPISGQRLARKLGDDRLSLQEWEQRFGRERITDAGPGDDRFRIEFSVESYLENHVRKFMKAFDANYLYLSRASDLFDLAEHGGSLAAGSAGSISSVSGSV